MRVGAIYQSSFFFKFQKKKNGHVMNITSFTAAVQCALHEDVYTADTSDTSEHSTIAAAAIGEHSST
jgi:hypothetical protein